MRQNHDENASFGMPTLATIRGCAVITIIHAVKNARQLELCIVDTSQTLDTHSSGQWLFAILALAVVELRSN